MSILALLWDLISGGALSSLLPIIGALLALVGAFFGIKRSGRKEAQAEAKASTYKKAYENETTRKRIEDDLARMSDDELDRLREQYSGS